MSLLLFDPLAKIMMILIGFVGTIVLSFCYKYMSLEKHYHLFLINIGLMMLSTTTLVCANYLPLFFVAWVTSNLLLVQLMKTNRAWPAAVASGNLAKRYFTVGFVCMAVAFVLMGCLSSVWYISQLSVSHSLLYVCALGLLLISGMIQSAIWPFNKWLLSSLNAPTPASAFMHAGLVNGGCFLMIRFAHLYVQVPILLQLMLIVGTMSALFGVFFKLIQTDVKRMLACSTMAQMGFVLVQCGAGLYPSALAHLCWHSIFKAYLFLSSMTVEYPKSKVTGGIKIKTFILATAIGLLGALVFASGNIFAVYNTTTLILLTVAFVASTQMALTMLRTISVATVLISILSSCLLAWMYRVIDVSFESVVSFHAVHSFELGVLHFVVIGLLLASWLCMVFFDYVMHIKVLHNLFVKLYLWAVRTSMPHASTITLHRNKYRYK